MNMLCMDVWILFEYEHAKHGYYLVLKSRVLSKAKSQTVFSSVSFFYTKKHVFFYILLICICLLFLFSISFVL